MVNTLIPACNVTYLCFFYICRVCLAALLKQWRQSTAARGTFPLLFRSSPSPSQVESAWAKNEAHLPDCLTPHAPQGFEHHKLGITEVTSWTHTLHFEHMQGDINPSFSRSWQIVFDPEECWVLFPRYLKISSTPCGPQCDHNCSCSHTLQHQSRELVFVQGREAPPSLK